MPAMIYFRQDDKPMMLKSGDSDEIANEIADAWKGGRTMACIGRNDDGDGIYINVMEVAIVTGPLNRG